ncbi:MAG: sugar phosphate isomerase/epimerase [Propionibacteriaceae bacterium]|jgi:sugar phosphate isomerase/epimerase|nr:sugar phosphate isomerase/epimerase [Propionibacteriaceae bacterium]
MSDLGGVRGTYEREDGTVGSYSMPAESRFSLTEFPGLVKERTGCTAVDVCQVQLADDSGSELDGFGLALEEAGVSLMALLLDVGNIASPEAERRAAVLRHVEGWLRRAAALQAPFARISTGAVQGAANHDRQAQLDSLAHCADYAMSVGVCLQLENHGGDALSPEWLIDTLEQVGLGRLGLILDIGNAEPMIAANLARLAGKPLDEASLDFGPVYATVAQLAPYATSVHAKVHDLDEAGGFGPLDVPRALRSIVAAGFRGPVTVEYEGPAVGDERWPVVRRSLETVNSIFGGGKES